MRKYLLATLTLLLGVGALGLVLVPSVVFGEPSAAQRTLAPAKDNRPTGITLATSRFSIHIGKDAASATSPVAAEPEPTRGKPFTIAGTVCSLSGFVLGPFAWLRRRQRSLAGCSLMLCCAALVWQYVLIGVAAGVGLAVLLLILAHA